MYLFHVVYTELFDFSDKNVKLSNCVFGIILVVYCAELLWKIKIPG